MWYDRKCHTKDLLVNIYLPKSPLVSGVAVIDNLLYAVGGSNRDDGTRSNLNTMERYNPEKDEWEDMPSMHRSRGAASVTALNGCLYAVGGYDSGLVEVGGGGGGWGWGHMVSSVHHLLSVLGHVVCMLIGEVVVCIFKQLFGIDQLI